MATGVSVAFGSDALAASPVYTRIDDRSGICVVTGWTTRRGRQYLTDRTEAGTCQISFRDTAGILDPTNSGGVFYPMDPNCPVSIALYNPVAATWTTIYTGLVQQVPQTVDLSAKVTTGTIEASDLFSQLALAEVPPGVDFDATNTGANTPNTIGDTTYAAQFVQDRIKAILADAGVPAGFTFIFTGNVDVQESVYSPGTKILAALQDAVDAEFPSVAQIFMSKSGVVTFHGRKARFNPTNYASFGITVWNAGDEPAVNAHSTWATVQSVSFDRDVDKVINASIMSPDGIADSAIAGQLSDDTASIAKYGVRGYSADNLLTQAGHSDGLGANAETKLYGNYFTDNYAAARTRITQASFGYLPATHAHASGQWAFLCGVEIGDVVNITTTHPGGGGFAAVAYFVEGISYTAAPIPSASRNEVDVTMTLDLSPASYYGVDPGFGS